MAYYSLLNVDKQETSGGVAARDRAEAVAIFGQQLGCHLSLEEDDSGVATYLLDEWWEQPHWVNHTIPVFVKRS